MQTTADVSCGLIQKSSLVRRAPLATNDISMMSTVGWSPEALVGVRQLILNDNAPKWATQARNSLIQRAHTAVKLQADVGIGLPRGPWNPTMKTTLPPSGDKRHYMTWGENAWPCNTSCSMAGFDQTQCKSWNTGARAAHTCNNNTGLPWVSREGFENYARHEDFKMLEKVMDTVEMLTLAWWFSTDEKNDRFVRTAATVIRAWFLDENEGMLPELPDTSLVPGYGIQTAEQIATTLSSRLVDCIAILSTAGKPIWTPQDDHAWQKWATNWLQWLHASKLSKLIVQSGGRRSTDLLIHKLALARAVHNTSIISNESQWLLTGRPASLSEQIKPSGEMPAATEGTDNMQESILGLTSLFKLGLTVRNACRGLPCSKIKIWTWEVNKSEAGGWKEHLHTGVVCNRTVPVDVDTLQKCKDKCAEIDKCNGVIVSKLAWECSLVECEVDDTKLKRIQKKLPYDTYLHKNGPSEGSGSIRRALDFLRGYALGQQNWSQDFPQLHAQTQTWSLLSLPLHLASVIYQNKTYEHDIKTIDTDGFFSNSSSVLVYPPPHSLA